MRTLAGVPKIDALFVGEVRISLLNYPDVAMETVVGYVESATGRRLGQTAKLGGWSPETLNRLSAFLESVEQDVAADFMTGTIGSGGTGIGPLPDGIPTL